MKEKEDSSFSIPGISSAIAALAGGSQPGQMISPIGDAFGSSQTIPLDAEIPAGFEAVGSAEYAPTAFGSTTLGSLLPALGAAAGAYTGAKQISGAGKLAQGQNPSWIEHAALFPLTGGFSLAGGLLGGGKGKDQQGRDAYRGGLQSSGFLDENYGLNLKGSPSFNLGSETLADGSKSYNVNFESANQDREKMTHQVVGAIDPLAEVMSGGDAKRRSDLAGQLTNAALNSEDPMRAVYNIYRKAEATQGLKPSTVKDQLQGLFDAGKIDESRKTGLFNSLNFVFNATRPKN